MDEKNPNRQKMEKPLGRRLVIFAMALFATIVFAVTGMFETITFGKVARYLIAGTVLVLGVGALFGFGIRPRGEPYKLCFKDLVLRIVVSFLAMLAAWFLAWYVF
jgi:hypothetical protein